jgi:hypothetical protein
MYKYELQVRMYLVIRYHLSILCQQARAQVLRFVQDDNVENGSAHRHLPMTTFNDNSE